MEKLKKYIVVFQNFLCCFFPKCFALSLFSMHGQLLKLFYKILRLLTDHGDLNHGKNFR